MKDVLTKIGVFGLVMGVIGIVTLLWAPVASASPITLMDLYGKTSDGVITYSEANSGPKSLELEGPGQLTISFSGKGLGSLNNRFIVNDEEYYFASHWGRVWEWNSSASELTYHKIGEYSAVFNVVPGSTTTIGFAFGAVTNDPSFLNRNLAITNLTYSFSSSAPVPPYTPPNTPPAPGNNPVPEPTSMLLLGIGLLGVARLGRSRK